MSQKTIREIQKAKGKDPIVMLTAYDFQTARMLEEGGVDILLVGDSLGNVVYGQDDTLAVTMEDMIRHTQAVSRAAASALVVGDMPFGSYQSSEETAIRNASRFLSEGGANAVKLEGGRAVASTISRLVKLGIPVMGHVGLTPQSVNQLGGFRTQGKTPKDAEQIFQDAVAVAEAGAFAIVLECVTPHLAKRITESIPIPTIGIGAGTYCDGQVLVTNDLIGYTVSHIPNFVKPAANLRNIVTEVVQRFVHDVKANHKVAAVDVGNTKTALAYFRGDTLIRQWQVETDAERKASDYEQIFNGLLAAVETNLSEIDLVAVASVVPKASKTLKSLRTKANVQFIDAKSPISFEIAIPDPDTLGADRIANIEGAIRKYGAPIIVIDFGTAITVSVVNRKKQFIGGAIAPGVGISLDALFSSAALLKRGKLDRPKKPIGSTTMEAIESGIHYGFAAMVDGLVAKAREELDDPEVKVVGKGGVIDLLAPYIDPTVQIFPTLTLEGIRRIGENINKLSTSTLKKKYA